MQSVGRSRYTVTQILLLVTPGGWGGGSCYSQAAVCRRTGARDEDAGHKCELRQLLQSDSWNKS